MTRNSNNNNSAAGGGGLGWAGYGMAPQEAGAWALSWLPYICLITVALPVTLTLVLAAAGAYADR